MAHELKRENSLRLHQALHGYSGGHRLLACSTKLTPRDTKTLLVLSDASCPTAEITEAGYLTGYPLTESGVYALARTWSAPEMPRPGCVWTHTLLIDFSDLALLERMDVLMRAFRRPLSDWPSGYDVEVPLRNWPHDSSTHLEDDRLDALRRLLSALYSSAKKRVIATNNDNVTSETLTLVLWSQQWPRLRRSFKFCTLASADRSHEGLSFDLQFVPVRERKAQFPGAIDTDRLEPERSKWLEAALADLLIGSKGELRSFLRQVGAEATGGRQAFVLLCRLYGLIQEFPQKPEAVTDAISLIGQSFDTSSASSAGRLVASAAAEYAELLDRQALNFVIQHLELLRFDDLENVGRRVGTALWSRDPAACCQLLTEEPASQLVAEKTLAALSLSDIVSGLHRSPEVMPIVLTRRPEVIGKPEFWTLDSLPRSEELSALKLNSDLVESALTAMRRAGKDNLIDEAVRAFGTDCVLQAVSTWLAEKGIENPSGIDAKWLTASVREENVVADALSRGVIRYQTVLVAIARETRPDFVPNLYGEDPWWTAVCHTKNDLSEQGKHYLYAYLMARAFSRRSRNQAELIKLGFDDVYSAALEARLLKEAWRLLEPHLPWSLLWFDWDYCPRLRAAVVDAFVGGQLSPLMFGQITNRDDFFTQLTETAARNGRGRRFLSEVKRTLENSDVKFESRVRILDRIV